MYYPSINTKCRYCNPVHYQVKSSQVMSGQFFIFHWRIGPKQGNASRLFPAIADFSPLSKILRTVDEYKLQCLET